MPCFVDTDGMILPISERRVLGGMKGRWEEEMEGEGVGETVVRM